MMAAKQVPDVNQFGTEMVPWASKGAMTPIDDYVKNSGMDLSKYDSKMVDAVTWDGKLWEVPYSSSTCVLYYNKDIFDKAGLDYPTHDWNDTNWTTDAFIELAQKLTIDKNGKNAAEDGFDPDNIVQYGVGGMQAMWFAPWYFGGDITDQTGTTYTGNDENTAKGIQFFADLSLKYHVMPTAEQSQALSAGGNIFLTGKVAMNVDGTWGATTMKDASFNWDIAATPIGTNHSVVLYTDGLGVGGNSQNPDGGWEFINWLNSSDENYLDFLKSTSGYMTIPSKLDTRDKVKSLLQEQFPDVDIDVMFNAVSVEDAKPVYMRYSENWNKLSSLLENEVYSVVNNGEKTAQQALSDVAKEAQDILDGK